jgi:hypothetical protein
VRRDERGGRKGEGRGSRREREQKGGEGALQGLLAIGPDHVSMGCISMLPGSKKASFNTGHAHPPRIDHLMYHARTTNAVLSTSTSISFNQDDR